jgi:hypothetical protein
MSTSAIKEKSEEQPKRRAAPPIGIPAVGRDLRKELLDKLDAENPDFVHSYKSPDIFGPQADAFSWEMEARQQEVVKDEKGRYLHHMGDPVVRQPRELVMQQREMESDSSREAVESVVRPELSTVERMPKQPIDRERKKGKG